MTLGEEGRVVFLKKNFWAPAALGREKLCFSPREVLLKGRKIRANTTRLHCGLMNVSRNHGSDTAGVSCRGQAFEKKRLASLFFEGPVYYWPKNLGTCLGKVGWVVDNANIRENDRVIGRFFARGAREL